MPLAWPLVVLALGLGALFVLGLAFRPPGALRTLLGRVEALESSRLTAAAFATETEELRKRLGACINEEGARKLTTRCNDITRDMVELKRLVTSLRATVSMRGIMPPGRIAGIAGGLGPPDLMPDELGEMASQKQWTGPDGTGQG
jgi:hypothetical protein